MLHSILLAASLLPLLTSGFPSGSGTCYSDLSTIRMNNPKNPDGGDYSITADDSFYRSSGKMITFTLDNAKAEGIIGILAYGEDSDLKRHGQWGTSTDGGNTQNLKAKNCSEGAMNSTITHTGRGVKSVPLTLTWTPPAGLDGAIGQISFKFLVLSATGKEFYTLATALPQDPVCTSEQFQVSNRTATNPRVCQDLRKCSEFQYESKAPNATSDRECQDLTVCPTESYAAVPHTTTSDRTCAPCACDQTRAKNNRCSLLTGQCMCEAAYAGRNCSDCNPNGFFLKNGTCTAVRVCNSSSEFESAAPSETTDRECQALTVCAENEYEAARDSTTVNKDRICTDCGCMTKNTVGGSTGCSGAQTNGQCNCLLGYTGRTCDSCKEGYNSTGCLPAPMEAMKAFSYRVSHSEVEASTFVVKKSSLPLFASLEVVFDLNEDNQITKTSTDPLKALVSLGQPVRPQENSPAGSRSVTVTEWMLADSRRKGGKQVWVGVFGQGVGELRVFDCSCLDACSCPADSQCPRAVKFAHGTPCPLKTDGNSTSLGFCDATSNCTDLDVSDEWEELEFDINLVVGQNHTDHAIARFAAILLSQNGKVNQTDFKVTGVLRRPDGSVTVQVAAKEEVVSQLQEAQGFTGREVDDDGHSTTGRDLMWAALGVFSFIFVALFVKHCFCQKEDSQTSAYATVHDPYYDEPTDAVRMHGVPALEK